MTLGNKIAFYRKNQNMTQEDLAQKLSVTNQAVSKWEQDQCCPDVTLLPKLADEFGVSLDELFDRAAPAPAATMEPTVEQTWPDDDTLRIMLFRGGKRLVDQEYARRVEIHWDGPALDLTSDFSVTCGEVEGDVTAGGSVSCDDVAGNVQAGGSVTCDDVAGNVQAGGNVTCDGVYGDLRAGGNVTCDNVEGNVSAGCDVTCDTITGSVQAGRVIYG